MVLKFRVSRYDGTPVREYRAICRTELTQDVVVRSFAQAAFETGMLLEVWEERG
jgi:hypothetical protein